MVDESTPMVLADMPCDKVLLLRLNRPNKRNAINNRLLRDLADQVRAAEKKQNVRCIVISGGETCFSAGADIKEIRELGIQAIHNRARSEDWSVLESTQLPMIAAVNGVCLGGGHELAMLCDLVIASNSAVFGQPEIKLGHIPGDGATQRLRRIVGKYAAMKMILTGETVDAQQGLKLGLAVEVVSEGNCEHRALEIASLIARHSLKALGFAKDAIKASDELPLSAGLECERRNIALVFTTKDQTEGMAAFFEKRQAEFKNE